jgi:outer membrane protein OmpA-like peptidoglycan-associated protein
MHRSHLVTAVLAVAFQLASAAEPSLPAWFPLAPYLKIDPNQVEAEDFGSESFDVSDGHGGSREVTVKGRHWHTSLYPAGDEWDGEEAWKRLRLRLEQQGFKIACLKLEPGRIVYATLQRGSGNEATFVEVTLAKEDAYSNSVKIIEPAVSARKLALKPPASQPESLSDGADFPYLTPLPGARRLSTTHDNHPLDVSSGATPQLEGSATVTKLYEGPDGLSDLEFASTYADALQAAGWKVLQRNTEPGGAGAVVAHFVSPTRDVWARLSRESATRWNAQVADVGAGLRTAFSQGCKAVLYGVNFDLDKATLRPDAEAPLQQALLVLKAGGPKNVEVGGHTDNTGTAAHNRTLSQARADSVRAWLVGHGIAATRLSAQGYGDTQPLKPNTDELGRALNRRVELRDPSCRAP